MDRSPRRDPAAVEMATAGTPATAGVADVDDDQDRSARRWSDALAAAALIAIDPRGLGGVALRARAGPVRDRWLAEWRALLPPEQQVRRMPLHIGDERLLGGLDLAATLRLGRPVAQTGLLAECDGGVLLVAMAERLSAGHAARLAAAIDQGEIRIEREGLGLSSDARFAVIALDEGDADDERPPPALTDRLGFWVGLDTLGWRDTQSLIEPTSAAEVAAARERLPAIGFDAEFAAALCGAASALGVASPRAAWLAWRAACAAAALRGGDAVDADDTALAARLVLAPRATRLPPQAEAEADAAETESETEPATEPETAEPPAGQDQPATASPSPPGPPSPPPEAAAEDGAEDEATPTPAQQEQALEEMLIAAALAALPPGLLASLRSGAVARQAQAGRAEAWAASARGGRPIGTRQGDPRGGARLSLVETLRAAAPWQALRRARPGADPSRRVEVQAGDFRIQRCQQRRSTTAIFVIDASGSAALQRLAEAKGAVNLLLADCYVRRDSVAVLAFRGRQAELLLPPTRSLVRAKRSLAALPGGGGTPLAAGIEAALTLAAQVRRSGATPVLVFLTDGRANVALDGSGGRAQADRDALRAARRVQGAGLASLVIDTSPKPAAAARTLATAMAARYSALPYAGSQQLTREVRELQNGLPGRRDSPGAGPPRSAPAQSTAAAGARPVSGATGGA